MEYIIPSQAQANTSELKHFFKLLGTNLTIWETYYKCPANQTL